LYKLIKKRVIQTLNAYPVTSLPIPIHSIEEIINENRYQVKNVGGLLKPCIFDTTIYCPTFKTSNDCRYALSHELGHIMIHGNTKSIIDHPAKHEAVADAFALYFTMPPYLFEEDLKRMNEWDLAEKYGVPVKQVLNRFKFCEGYRYH
jgi:Zn-dependent peptidase ImmA (M78 family)